MTDSDQTEDTTAQETARPDEPAHPEEPARPEAEEMPDADDMEEPSAEKEVGEEPKAPARDEPEPSHEAVGIGVVGRPQVETADPGAAPDEEPVDVEHSDVISDEQREKRDEDEQADHLLHDEDLPDPSIEP